MRWQKKKPDTPTPPPVVQATQALPAPRSAPPATPQPTAAAPATPSTTDTVGDDLDDGDALPAVGKVWEDGPKRSLGEILAEAARKREAAAGPQVQPTERRPAALPGDLASIWPATLQQVQDEIGPAVHVPLASGVPSRDGDTVTVRFAGAFAGMASYLQKHRDDIQRILSSVAGEALQLRLEAVESARAPAPATGAAPGNRTDYRRQQADRPMPAPPVRETGMALTPELRAQLEKDPLIRAVMEQFDGNIVKVEE